MGFTETGFAVDEKRVVNAAGIICYGNCGNVRELVGGTDDKVTESGFEF